MQKDRIIIAKCNRLFYNITDIDECSEVLDSCDMNADCTDTDGSFTCTCQVGFSGDGLTCTSKKCVVLMVVAKGGSIEYPFRIDINECSEVLHNCDMNADCVDTDGSFTCTCREGFGGNGVTCTSQEAVSGMQECVVGE